MNKRDSRQKAYGQRARAARSFARLLMPVTLLVASSAMWQDPVLGPKLAGGLEVIRPTAASYLADTPLEGVFGPAPLEDGEEVTSDDRLARASRLPTIEASTIEN